MSEASWKPFTGSRPLELELQRWTLFPTQAHSSRCDERACRFRGLYHWCCVCMCLTAVKLFGTHNGYERQQQYTKLILCRRVMRLHSLSPRECAATHSQCSLSPAFTSRSWLSSIQARYLVAFRKINSAFVLEQPSERCVTSKPDGDLLLALPHPCSVHVTCTVP